MTFKQRQLNLKEKGMEYEFRTQTKSFCFGTFLSMITTLISICMHVSWKKTGRGVRRQPPRC